MDVSDGEYAILQNLPLHVFESAMTFHRFAGLCKSETYEKIIIHFETRAESNNCQHLL
jgi:hypothetical protein